MKKNVALLVVLFSVIAPVQSQATVGERIVIIDSYFDQSKITGSIEFVCLATDKCANKPTPKPGMGTDPANHGTLMAEIARKQNLTATLVLVQTEEVVKKSTGSMDVTTLDPSDFIRALTWVNLNKLNVSAVSFSYNLTPASSKMGDCKPATVSGVAVSVTDGSIKTLVASLKTVGIPVIASAGNDITKPLQYPACIPDVISVGSLASPQYYGLQADVAGNLVNTQKNYLQSSWFGAVSFTTSAATAAYAANYKTISVNSNRIINIIQ